jgi:hypothetical protein
VLATIVLGLVAGGIAGVLFVTAQLTADPNLTTGPGLVPYARRSIPFALGVDSYPDSPRTLCSASCSTSMWFALRGSIRLHHGPRRPLLQPSGPA